MFDWIHDSEILCFDYPKFGGGSAVAGCFTLRIGRRRSNALQPNKAIRLSVQSFEMICHGGEGDRAVLPIFDLMSQQNGKCEITKIQGAIFGVV